MTKLFKKKPEGEKVFKNILVGFTAAGWEHLCKQADARNLSRNEFIRRAVDGRRADVRHETNVVLVMGRFIEEVNLLRKDLHTRGLLDEEKKWEDVRNKAIEAMLRIEN